MLLAALIYMSVVGFIVALGFFASFGFSYVAVKDGIFRKQDNPTPLYHPVRRS